MPAIGITGSIATGKSTFARFMRTIMPQAGFFDADQAARNLTDHDAEARDEIRSMFGDEVYSAGGDLNRRRLRAIILSSATKRVALEQILHPRIRSQWSAEAQRYRNSSDFFFADIPLLYETGGETLCDRVVVVACSSEVQLQRLLERGAGRGGDGNPEVRKSITAPEAAEMIKTQMSIQQKIDRADHVVWNNDGLTILEEQARDLARLWQTVSWTAS